MADVFVWSGSTLTTNGGFDSDTGWTKGTGWSIAAGVATKTAGTASDLEQNQNLTNTVTYTIKFTLSNVTGGTLTPRLAGTSGTARSTNGTFQEDIVAGAGGEPKLELVADSTFAGDVDNVQVSENSGASWDTAYWTLAKDWSAEAGFTPATNFIYVRDSHSETSSTTLTITGSVAEGTTEPTRILCVVGAASGTTPGARSSGAAVNTDVATADIFVEGGLYLDGVTLSSNDDLWTHNSASLDCDVTYENCRLEVNNTASKSIRFSGTGAVNIAKKARLINCVLSFGNTSSNINAANFEDILILGGSIEDAQTTLFTFFGAGGRAFVRVIGLDCSSMASSANMVNVNPSTDTESHIIFINCKFPTSHTLVNTDIDVGGKVVEAYHCQEGTDADPVYIIQKVTQEGRVVTDATRYRAGAKRDNVRATPVSWDVDTTAGSKRQWPGHGFECPPIIAWTAGDGSTTKTYRIYFASDATINDDELAMYIVGPNSAATDSLGEVNTTRLAPRGTAAALPTDSAGTWVGTGVNIKQYLEVSYIPDKPGPVYAYILCYKDADHIYVQPEIFIDP